MTDTETPKASFAEVLEDGRLFAPSAERNSDALTHVISQVAPTKGRAVELASGTGQHIVRFASACPGLIWVPTDVDETRLSSIQTYVAEAQLPNLSPPMPLNAVEPGWSENTGKVDMVVLVNLLHLISAPKAQTVITEIAKALATAGTALVYGPFLRDGKTTSDGDARFHASLRESDPEIGYKDISDVIDWAEQAGAPVIEQIEMPANNIAFVLRKLE